jgi:anti-sigma factor RsiW
MNNPNPLTPEEQQNLVAYLDGELDEKQSRHVAELLSRSAAARLELERLQKTWDLLDYLPQPKAPRSFTHQTVQRLQTVRLTQSIRVRRQRWLGGLSWAAALLAAGSLSFFVMQRQPPDKLPRPTPEEVQVLEHREFWPQYQRIENLEFLRELDRPDLFGEES